MTLVTLVSSEGQCFRVDKSIAKQSLTVSRLLEALAPNESDEINDDTQIPLPNVTSKTLQKVIEWFTDYQDSAVEVGNEDLFDLILAANYMDIKDLLDLGCKRVADMLKNKSPADICKTFGIVDDLSPEEHKQICKETAYFDFAFPPNKEYEEIDIVFRLLDLPNEIISIVIQQLNIVDRLRARVCRRLLMLEQLGRYHINKLDLILGDISSSVIRPERLELTIVLCNFNSNVSFNFIIESYIALLKNIANNTAVENLTLCRKYGSSSNFDPTELMPYINEIPTRELTITNTTGQLDVKNDSLADIAKSKIALRRFRVAATNRTLMYLLRNIGITLVNNQFISTRADVRAFAEVSMFFGSKYFFLIGENMIITTDGGILQYNEGELWIERHNDDGSMPDLPCFAEDIPISYIIDCDPLTVVYK